MGDSSSLSSRFEYLELECDSRGALTSAQGGTSPSNWPQLFFSNIDFNPAGIKVLSAEIPFVFDVISQENNSFYLNTGSGNVLARISVGTYNSAQLVTAFKSALNSVSSGWDVSYDVDQFKYTVTRGGSWSLLFQKFTSPGYYLGFPAGVSTSSGGVLKSPNAAESTGPNYLHLNSRTIGPTIKCFTDDNDELVTQICRIPINVQKGSVIFYNDPNPTQYFDFVAGHQFGSFDLFLSLGYEHVQTPLDLKGLGFSVKLGLLNYRSGGISIGSVRAERRGGVSVLNP